MTDQPNQRRLSAILAADVVEYTRHMERDSDGTVTAWQRAREEVINPTVAGHSGKIVKLTGDGFLVEFSTVLDAVNCAISMQRGLATNKLDFRMGINLGDVIDDGEDIHGEGVNIAARIEALASPGGIGISGSVYDQVRNRVEHRFEDYGEHQVKHVSAPVRVWRWSSDDRSTVPVADTIPIPKRHCRYRTNRRSRSCASTISAVIRNRNISRMVSPRTSSPSCQKFPVCSSLRGILLLSTRGSRYRSSRSGGILACAT